VESRSSIADVSLLVYLPNLSPVSSPRLDEKRCGGSLLHLVRISTVVNVHNQVVCSVANAELRGDWYQSPAAVSWRGAYVEWTNIHTSTNMITLNSQSLAVECRNDALSLEVPNLMTLSSWTNHTCEWSGSILVSMMQVVARCCITDLSIVYLPKLSPTVGLLRDTERRRGTLWHLVRIEVWIIVDVQEETVCTVLNAVLR